MIYQVDQVDQVNQLVRVYIGTGVGTGEEGKDGEGKDGEGKGREGKVEDKRGNTSFLLHTLL